MTVIKIFEIAAGIIFIISTITVALWFIGETRKKAYNKDYAFLFSCVSYYVVSHHNYEKICHMFRQLRMNDQNPEMTNALWSVFQARYNAYFQNDDMAVVELKN